MRYTLTSETVTLESLERCEAEYGIEDTGEASLSEVLRVARDHGIVGRSRFDLTRWWSSVDPVRDYRTGAETFYSLHIDGLTPRDFERVNQVFMMKLGGSL